MKGNNNNLKQNNNSHYTNIKPDEKENNHKNKTSYSNNKRSIKRKNNKKIEIFPLIKIKNRSKKILIKNVKEDNNTESSISSKKTYTLKIKNDIKFKTKNEVNINIINTEEPLILENNDSSYFENNNSNNNNLINIKKDIHSNTINSHTINSYFSKSMHACKNKKRKINDSETLNDVFKQLLDIKHKIREVKDKKRNKIFQFNTTLSYSKNSSSSPKKINFKLSRNIQNRNKNNTINYNNNKSYNFNTTFFNPTSKTPKNSRVLRRANTLKPNINIINFRNSANLYKRFNEHIKYILHIRENEMNSLASQFQKALDENEKEKDFHYKNRVFPLDIINKIIQIKDDLTLNKYRNEYFKRLDRYDIHPLNKFLDFQKKNVNANKAKIFKGIFSKMIKTK